jgi:hypothetical protein
MKLVDDQAPYIWRCPKCGRTWGTRAEVLVEGDNPDCDGTPMKIRAPIAQNWTRDSSSVMEC